uniref:Ig-like domain-containing protein n=1 Tax=Aquila chrysaetos chrysaetos TaxID=223781 RepID=A0A663E514_AQUCH
MQGRVSFFPSLPFPSLPFPSPPLPLPSPLAPLSPLLPAGAQGTHSSRLTHSVKLLPKGVPSSSRMALLTLHQGGFAQEIPVQSPMSITKSKGSVRLQCNFKDVSEAFDTTIIHWYQQKANKSPQRILYFSDGKVSCIVIAKTLFTVMGYYPKVFGSGTKLTVSGKLHAIFHTIRNSPPAHSEILQKNHGNQTTYVCLIEKFYPEVIRVTWTDEAHKEVTDNVVQGDPWKATKEGKYSISSWLTVSAANKDKNYHCKYEHESKEHSLQAQGTYYMLRIFILRIIRDLTFSLQ